MKIEIRYIVRDNHGKTVGGRETLSEAKELAEREARRNPPKVYLLYELREMVQVQPPPPPPIPPVEWKTYDPNTIQDRDNQESDED